MKKNKNNLLIGALLTLCILIPLFYFTISNTQLNLFSKKINFNKSKIGFIENNNNESKISNENYKTNNDMINYEDNGTKSSGISHVKVPTIFPKSFAFGKPYVYYSYTQRPNSTFTEAPIAGTIQSPTNNLKPIPKPETTKRVSPNVVETPRSYTKSKPNLTVSSPTKNTIPNTPKESTQPNEKKPIPTPVPNNIETQKPIPTTETKTPVPTKNIVPKEQEQVQKIPVTPSAHTNISSLADVEQAIFNQVNVERSKVGLPLLSYNKTMEKYARIKSKDMGDKNYFSHEDPQGNLITVQMNKDGVKYKAWGENIASRAGGIDYKKLSDQFMTQWMNSSGHRANILSKDFQSIGVGLYQIGNEVFATQEFYK